MMAPPTSVMQVLSICPFYQFKNEHKTLQAKITLIKKEQKNQINGIELA